MPGGGARRVNVSPSDRFFLLGEGYAPAPVGMLGVAIEGEAPERMRLIDAVARTMAEHPKTASRLARERGSFGERLIWEHVPELAAEVCRFHERSEFPGDRRSIDALFTSLANEPLEASVGPILEVHAYSDEVSRGLIILRFHHALGDGYGLVRFLRDLLAAYSGDPVAVEPVASEDEVVRLGRLALLANLVRFYWRRGRRIRFEPPDKLYDPAREPGERVAVEFRYLEEALTTRLRRAARAHEARFNDVLLAAWAMGIERWKRERAQPCGTIRVMVNRGLREVGSGGVENHSSAFPVWVQPADRGDRDLLLHGISEQTEECIEQHIPEAIGLLGGVMRLPMGLVRKLVAARASRARDSDSLILSNLGPLPVATPAEPRGMRFGQGRVVATYPAIRAPRGPGALCACASTDGLFVMGLSYVVGLFDPGEVSRLLDAVEAELRAFAVGTA